MRVRPQGRPRVLFSFRRLCFSYRPWRAPLVVHLLTRTTNGLDERGGPYKKMRNTTSGKIKTNLRDVTNLGNGFFLFRFLWVNLWPKKIRYRQWLTEKVRGRITKIVTSIFFNVLSFSRLLASLSSLPSH